ncbi:hypothetical protein LEMA_P073890.1 [Plenodomus lingam JN3]|uniref:Uncharacterized protein n=1 Tax=Leptosphaeria maculans (strain JN3 / isolate v23.1.3 / race Av1-4-5-6-7-8) TaxID=985895 RepID=E5A855_LEPMJ|nr:hypothetical protein LEMA_P073890.1 [Plenodomus lingam JN3]CBX99800.1 hypothetical protein LEMA_P073890.1 [Plenodomus lingam JN3]
MNVAFEELERTVTPADSGAFRSVEVEHVRIEALDIEKQLAVRQALCNMRRLEPLLRGLEHYARVVDVLCNGTPFLPWIWAPITLILRVASEYMESFQQIMKGYSRIADALGRFKILSDTFIAEPGFQQILAVFYADILQYHIHAYRFVRRPGWKLLFLTSWGRFQRRFDNILQDLEYHGQLVDQEANALSIAAMADLRQQHTDWREKSLHGIILAEKQQAVREYTSILSWLKVDESEQGQIIEAISDEEAKFPGTCSWLSKDMKIKLWLRAKPEQPFLWLQGNPGCGKSVIAAKLVYFLQLTAVKAPSTNRVICHFCTYTFPSSTRYEGVLKSIIRQLLLNSDELTAHVYQECIVGKKQASTIFLERLILTLITALSDEPHEPLWIWIIIDGINECENEKQARLVSLMNQISSLPASNHGVTCKVLLTTRPSPNVRGFLKTKRKQVIYLSDEQSPLLSAIRLYVSRRLDSMHVKLQQLELEAHEIEAMEELVSQKASGMFLYARLVLDYINANIFFTGDELRDAINQLPATLNEFYQKLLYQILARLNEQSQERVRCIFGWIAFAKRPLKKLEFLSALSFTSGNYNLTRLVPRYVVEDICSSLVEERRDGSLTFIHVSVKHFLQTSSSAIILREEESLNEHGIAAVSCLLSGLQVMNESYDEQKKMLRFVKGIHGFHVYATEYWTEYLLANARTTGGLKKGLVEVATRLADVLDKLEDTSPLGFPLPKATIDIKDDRLALLEGYGSLRKHMERSLFARSKQRFESELQATTGPASGVPKTFVHQDGISAALDLYQKTVETILGQDSCPGASAKELELFKSQFRTSAYTCRLRSCPRATIGFKNQQLRQEHEVCHAGGFRCSFAGCQYPPYRNQRSLSAHVASVHESAIKLPRRTIRKSGNFRLKVKSSITGHEGNPRAMFEPDQVSAVPEPTPLEKQIISGEPRVDERVLDTGSDSDVGIGYVDIVMDKIIGGTGISMDPALANRVNASLFQNMNAMCSLAEIADNLRDGSAEALTPELIITKIWSNCHPELAQELRQFICGQNVASEEANQVSRHCSCHEKDTEDMIVCYNATCPRGWFHLSCVNRVITPVQGETWFCSIACEKAEKAREKDDEDASDSDYY